MGQPDLIVSAMEAEHTQDTERRETGSLLDMAAALCTVSEERWEGEPLFKIPRKTKALKTHP